jgi:ribosomal protein L16 Arg81 hydroxylase
MSNRPLSLEWLLSPVKTRSFFIDHLEKELLIVHGRNARKFDRLLSVCDLDVILWQQEGRLRSIVSAYKESKELHPDRYVSDADHRRWLRDVYQGGGTLIIKDLDRFCLPVAQLKRALVDRFTAAVSLNAYLTPPSAIGFAAHSDRHDVFILQIAGSKTWTIAKAPEKLLPNERQSQLQNVPLQSLDKDSMDILLSAGDLLYLPRGIVHKAETTKDYSVHLTFGVRPCNWSQIAISMVQLFEDSDVSLRKAAWAPSQAPALVKNLDKLICAQLRISDSLQEAFKRVRRDLITRMPLLPDDTVNVFASDFVGSKTFVQLRYGMKCAVNTNDQTVEITFPGLGSSSDPESIEAPRALEEAFRFIAETDRPFRVSELPGAISNSAKEIVVRRLLRDGLLKVARRLELR